MPILAIVIKSKEKDMVEMVYEYRKKHFTAQK